MYAKASATNGLKLSLTRFRIRDIISTNPEKHAVLNVCVFLDLFLPHTLNALHHLSSVRYRGLGHKNSRGQVIRVTKFGTALNSYGSTVRNLLYVTQLAPRILKQFLIFCKICATLKGSLHWSTQVSFKYLYRSMRLYEMCVRARRRNCFEYYCTQLSISDYHLRSNYGPRSKMKYIVRRKGNFQEKATSLE